MLSKHSLGIGRQVSCTPFLVIVIVKYSAFAGHYCDTIRELSCLLHVLMNLNLMNLMAEDVPGAKIHCTLFSIIWKPCCIAV